MFSEMEKNRAAESADRGISKTPVHRNGHHKKIPCTPDLWSALTSAIANDVNEFNNHKERAGQMAVGISKHQSHCEVYLPGMQSKRLVLALDDNDLKVSVHPDFPEQLLAITIELDGEGPRGFWVLGDNTQESSRLSVEQLSEYLLKPIFSRCESSGRM